MIDTLIVARDNRYGLTKDAELLSGALSEAGIVSRIARVSDRGLLERLFRRRVARRIIHLERVFPRWLTAGRQNLLIPNQERFPLRHLDRLRRIDLLLAKTREACQVFDGRGAAVEYLGFTSEDRYQESVEKNPGRILHLAGGSTLKGTEEVLAAWELHPEWPQLLLVQKGENAPKRVPSNVSLITRYVPDGELRRLQNECAIHLCPSRAEGWGHNIVEAMSCKALVITTNAPPMNEHVDAACSLLVTPLRREPRHLGTSHYVGHALLEAAVQAAIALPPALRSAMGERARRRFLDGDGSFRKRIADLIARLD